MPNIAVTVTNKCAVGDGTEIVCGNSDYMVNFTFDSEWDEYSTKTARFVYNNGKNYTDVIFTGTQCAMPVLIRQHRVAIGVYAGDLHTTTPAIFPCRFSILCDGGVEPDPTPDVYNQIMEAIEDIPKGDDGFSPTVNVFSDNTGNLIVITDANGSKTARVENGVSPTVEMTDVTGGIALKITDKDGVHSTIIYDGNDGLPGDEASDYELIADVTTTEATSNMTVNTDTSGNAISLKAAKVLITSGVGSEASALYIKFSKGTQSEGYEKIISALITSLVGTSVKYASAHLRRCGNIFDYEHTLSTSNPNSAVAKYTIPNFFESYSPITQIELIDSTGNMKIPAGTNIKVYGASA